MIPKPKIVRTAWKVSSRTYLDVINPDKVSTVQGDGITTPDVLRIEVRNVHILNDDVAGTANNLQALSLDYSGTTGADK